MRYTGETYHQASLKGYVREKCLLITDSALRLRMVKMACAGHLSLDLWAKLLPLKWNTTFLFWNHTAKFKEKNITSLIKTVEVEWIGNIFGDLAYVKTTSLVQPSRGILMSINSKYFGYCLSSECERCRKPHSPWGIYRVLFHPCLLDRGPCVDSLDGVILVY